MNTSNLRIQMPKLRRISRTSTPVATPVYNFSNTNETPIYKINKNQNKSTPIGNITNIKAQKNKYTRSRSPSKSNPVYLAPSPIPNSARRFSVNNKTLKTFIGLNNKSYIQRQNGKRNLTKNNNKISFSPIPVRSRKTRKLRR